MNLTNYYWFFQSAILPRVCDRIIAVGNAKNPEGGERAITGRFSDGTNEKRDLKKKPLTKKELKELKKKRDSKIIWLDEKWIYQLIQPFVYTANKNAGWNYEWDWSETSQFTIYKKGQYYDWHSDSWDKPYKNGKVRKLSMTINLTDPKEYKGGELEFDFRNMDPHKKRNLKVCSEIMPKGSVVVFPSFVWHRIKPIMEGVRHSLVSWHTGYPFK
jgi:PKHD-type hydroxylase